MKVVVCGQGPRSFEHPDDHEVWVINGPELPERWDRLYQLHGLDHIRRKHEDFYEELGAGMVGIATNVDQRIIMTQEHDHVPGSEPYPLGEVLDAFPRSYFTNSFAYVIAHAILDGAEKILLDGVLYAQGDGQWGASEGWAVACVEYWIGVAEGRGIEVGVPAGSGLMRHAEFLYGFEGPGSA